MSNERINIDGVWYVREDNTPIKEEEIETPTLSKQAETTSGNFIFSVLLKDDGSIWKNTQSVMVRGEEGEELWDNHEWLIEFRDKKGRVINNDNPLNGVHTDELLYLLNYVTELNWL